MGLKPSNENGEDAGPGGLSSFLALVEKHGATTLPSRALARLVPLAERTALTAAGVLAGAEAVTSWPCDVRGCGREIRANFAGARKPLVALCSQAPPVCAPVELRFDEVSQQQVSVRALVELACALLKADSDPDALTMLNASHPVGRAPLPARVATLARGREVFWTRAPRDLDLGAFCARRERVKRRTLVLVPTTRHVPLETAARFASGERVEILALDDLLAIRAGAIVLRETLSRDPARPSLRAPSSPGALAATLGVTRWEDMRLLFVDEHTLRIEGTRETLVRSFVDLGFIDGRKKDVVPVISWHVLLILCLKGVLRPSEYARFGKQWGAKKGLGDLRRRLRGAFGLESDPLLGYLTRMGWRPRFRVAPSRT